MSEIHVRENESLESALKRFKRSCAKSGVLAEVRRREHYESPSVKRRKKSEAARKNHKRYYRLFRIPVRPKSDRVFPWTVAYARGPFCQPSWEGTSQRSAISG